MAKCASCGTIIVFGGKKQGDLRFCSDKCYGQKVFLQTASQVPEDVVRRRVEEVHLGTCPICKGRGPCDAHTSYRVWAFFRISRWYSVAQISCRSCGVKSQLKSIAFSFFLGWWSPFGLIMTPVQIIRNIMEIKSNQPLLRPSPRLEQLVRNDIAKQMLVNQHAIQTKMS